MSGGGGVNSVDVAAIRARAEAADDAIEDGNPPSVEDVAKLAEWVPALLSALGVAEARAQEAEATLEQVKAALESTAIYRPDAELYGEDVWDQIETVDIRVVRAALHGVPSQPPTTQGDHT